MGSRRSRRQKDIGTGINAKGTVGTASTVNGTATVNVGPEFCGNVFGPASREKRLVVR